MQFPEFSRDTLRRFSRNHVAVALLITVILVLWLASGDFLRTQSEAPEAEQRAPETSAYRVETSRLHAQQHAPVQVVQGQLEPGHVIEIQSQINAHLTERLVEWGAAVTQGQLLFRLNPETRAAELARAEANLELSELEARAGAVLFKKNLLSETDYLRRQAEAAAARADRELFALQLKYAEIAAPFNGIVDRLPVEEGAYVEVGQALGTLVDISSLRLIAYIPQQQVSALQPGLEVEATLLDGKKLAGTLTFVASFAEASTRSFRVEARVENPDLLRIAGASATLTIRLPEQAAHRLSPASLILGDDGQLGIKSVNAERHVDFLPLKILSFDPDGVWVQGLPDEIELITLGAGFVAVGDAVNPVSTAEQP